MSAVCCREEDRAQLVHSLNGVMNSRAQVRGNHNKGGNYHHLPLLKALPANRHWARASLVLVVAVVFIKCRAPHTTAANQLTSSGPLECRTPNCRELSLNWSSPLVIALVVRRSWSQIALGRAFSRHHPFSAVVAHGPVLAWKFATNQQVNSHM